MAVTDPVDARLLAVLADLGKAAVHEIAAKIGMDPREVAYRLVNLSATGLPLLVGVESDPNGLRAALAAQQPQQPPPQQPPPPSPPQGQVQGTPSGAYPVQGAPSGAYAVQGTPSGRYPPPPPHQQHQHQQHQQQQQPWPPQQPPPARPPQQPPQQAPQQPPPQPDPVISTWGPPQSALWARGDQPPSSGVQAPAPPAPAVPHSGRAGDVLETQGLEGEQLAIQLLEVQDPADYLFGAAGYRLDEGERAVVVHTEVTNRGNTPFASLPDNYLELITADGRTIGKAPVSLTSRPPHKIGVQPGETTGGHTVYVLPDATRIASVRWSPRPEPDERSLLWSVDD